MADASSFLFGSSTPSSFTNQTVDTSTMPAWYQDAIKGLITKTSQIAGQDYQPYQGQRLAGLTNDQTQANDMTRNLVSQGNPYSTQAADMINGATNFDQNKFNSFLNPYTQQANDALEQQGMRNFNLNTAPAINNSFIGSGMFGGSRNADVYEQALTDNQQNILNQQSTNNNANYNNAMQNYLTSNNQAIAGGNALSNIGQQQFTTGLAGAAALSGIGSQQQQQNQAGLDLAYQDFTNQKNYPTDQLNLLNNIIHGISGTTGSSVTQTTNPLAYQTNSPLSSVLSALSQGSAAGNTNGNK